MLHNVIAYFVVQVRALFSATLPEGVEELASSVLQSPLRLTVGVRNTPNSSVAQRLMFVGREGGKLLGLRQLIAQGLTPPVLLFVSSKERAEAVHRQVPCSIFVAGASLGSQICLCRHEIFFPKSGSAKLKLSLHTAAE